MEEEKIRRFFARACTPEEAREVTRYLYEHPEEWQRWLPASEWDKAAAAGPSPEAWNEIWKRIDPARKSRGKRILWQTIAAAAAIAGIFLVVSRHAVSPVRRLPAETSAVAGTVQRKTLRNTQGGTLLAMLPDGSEVSLAPDATLSYDEPLPVAARPVYLTGEAYFKVAPDARRPFTVYAGYFSTTALGTEFRVIPMAGHGISVHLIKGKVVVRAIKEKLAGWTRDIVLTPGNRLIYDGLAGTAAVKPFRGEDTPRAASKPRLPRLHVEETANGINFEGERLSAALDRLARFYQTPIRYEPASLRGMHFTGQIDRGDSLAVVLRVIGQMNNLTVESDSGRFVLRK